MSAAVIEAEVYQKIIVVVVAVLFITFSVVFSGNFAPSLSENEQPQQKLEHAQALGKIEVFISFRGYH
ncbi:hypothetical protein [Salinimonas iocasae]|uniref:Uncharacterized protein n=1 Tax=Salinimonas iocasae TaxID=2572577 RepID=A0A5B7YC71_9ALTE|nr:hypothetical protein [Salinimonas iocasae]QCZ93138.1 hypothetical protein FBQ74_06395 [Salinimonas iocasae]